MPVGVSTLTRPDPVLFRKIVEGETTGRAAPAPVPARRRARRLAPGLVVISLLGGAAAYALLSGGVSKPHTVACFDRLDLSARAEVVTVDDRGPLAACAELWRAGVLGPAGDVPQLTECVLGSGAVGVFPSTSGPDACAQLVLAPVPSTAPPPVPGSLSRTQGDVTARFLAFRDAVLPQFLATACMDPRVGAGIVRRELVAAGLADWTVRGGEGVAGDGFSVDRPCATLAFHPESREIVLVPGTPRP